MANHILIMSFDDKSYLQLNSTMDRFFQYALVLLQKNKKINFCYIGTASNDSFIENLFFTGFISAKFLGRVIVSKLSLTTNLSIEEVENHIRRQDIIFIGGGNTEFMLKTWKNKGFEDVLNKLKHEDQLPLIAGLSAGGMFQFHSSLSLTSHSPKEYIVLSSYNWIPGSFCPHADSEIQAVCKFDNEKKHTRGSAYETAIRLGKLPPGYSVPNNCMLHFYGENFVDAFSAVENVACSFVTPKQAKQIETKFLKPDNLNHFAKINCSN